MRSHLYYKVIVVCLCLLVMTAPAQAQYQGFSDPGSRVAATSGGSGGIAPVEANIDGGIIPIGATAQVVVLFRNGGSQPVETGVINLYPSSTVSGSISLNQCNVGALPPGADCAIALSVKALQPGPWRLEMLMRHSGRSRVVTATLSGSVENSSDSTSKLVSDIEAIPDSVDFGSLTAGKTLVEGIVLRNVTSNPINMGSLYIEASNQSGYELKTECETLGAGEACIATITWSPRLSGPSSGVFVIKHDGPTALTSVTLKGEYSPDAVDEAEVFPEAVPGKGLLVSSQTEVDFGADVRSASTITVSLVNAGDEPLVIGDIRIAGKDNGLSFSGTGCKALSVLQPIEACPLTILWSPTRVGTLLDDVQVIHDGARGILVLPVRGVSETVVSQDQKAIVLGSMSDVIIESVIANDLMNTGVPSGVRPPPPTPGNFPVVADSASVLDGLRITSFSVNRAIVKGPSGSRILFDGQEALIGGVPWFIVIQPNGIEFINGQQRVLLLFDRSLAPIIGSSNGSISSSSGTTSSFSSGEGN